MTGSCGPALLAVALFAPHAVAEPPVAAATGATATADASGRLQGRAYLGRRQGVVGVAVVARPADDPGRLFVTSSDTRGTFSFDGLPDGEYVVELRRDGLRPVRKDGVVVRTPFRAVVELPMAPATPDAPGEAQPAEPAAAAGTLVALSGRVTDGEGSPVGDALMRLVHAAAAADPRVIRSGRGGRFAVDGLPAGRWELEVRDVGALPIRTVVDLLADAELRVTLLPQPADYAPSPLELMPSEEPLPPPGLADQSSSPPRTAK